MEGGKCETVGQHPRHSWLLYRNRNKIAYLTKNPGPKNLLISSSTNSEHPHLCNWSFKFSNSCSRTRCCQRKSSAAFVRRIASQSMSFLYLACTGASSLAISISYFRLILSTSASYFCLPILSAKGAYVIVAQYSRSADTSIGYVFSEVFLYASRNASYSNNRLASVESCCCSISQ